MTPTEMLDRIERLFAERGGGEYHGEAVTQLEHALQAATLAEQNGLSPQAISAALLHDIGHLLHAHGEDCATQGLDDRHEELGVRFLSKAFGPEVTEPIRLHVAAKRYLTAVRPEYFSLLSAASIRSLGLQGGPMSAAEVRRFEANPHCGVVVRVREYDDRAKVVGLATPSFAYFCRFLEAALHADA
jgi:[1-hydroxy-2-(trimethylamino)ethyl]phosphonate dioxygenase